MSPIAKLFDERGVTTTQLARVLGVTQQCCSGWRTAGRIPAEMVGKVERATGIPRHLLRPDLWKPGDTPYSSEEAVRIELMAIRRFEKLRLRIKNLAAEADALAKELFP